MSWSVHGDVIDVARLIYPDMSAADAMTFFNIIRPKVLRRLGLHQITSTINLVAGTQEYALGSSVVRVNAVEYRKSATLSDFIALQPTSLAYLEQEEPKFRGYSTGDPRRFYLTEGATGPLIGLVPAPNATTSGGYPIITVYENSYDTLILNGTFSDDLPDVEVYTRGIARTFAEKNDTSNYAMRDALYQQSLNEAQDYLYKKNANLMTTMRPAWMKRRGII